MTKFTTQASTKTKIPIKKIAHYMGVKITNEKPKFGKNGIVYFTECGKALKITNDTSEFSCANDLENIKNDHYVFIHKTKKINNFNVILMERLKPCKIDHLIEEITFFCHNIYDSDYSIWDISINKEEASLLSEESIKLLNDIQLSKKFLLSHSIVAMDIHEKNIMLKSNGKYSLIDQTMSLNENY